MKKRPQVHFAAPHPWARTGPGAALDGQPRFNLKQWDAAYFKRLRERVASARERGIYVSIMLFEGWGMQFVKNGWQAHPFHPANNVNGMDGDKNGDGRGLEIHTLDHSPVTALQEAYVRKVIDTVNDLDNVLYEISNENHPPSTEWQYHMIRFIHQYERSKPRQHPVGMTFQYKGGANSTLFHSPADWVSPNPNADGGLDYQKNPPPGDGRKVVLTDTDHLWGIGGDAPWVWKSFLRGLNPIFMDPYDNSVLARDSHEQWERARVAMGQTRRVAARIDLAGLTPHLELASSKYCLANPGKAYLVYLAGGPEVTVDLSAAEGKFAMEWFNTQTSAFGHRGAIEAGAKRVFKAPSNTDTVLYLYRHR